MAGDEESRASGRDAATGEDAKGHPETDESPPTRQKTNATRAASDAEPESPKPSRWKVWWDKVGLDWGTVMMMFKGSLPPTIGIAIYQAGPVAAEFTNIGYLIAIISILSMAILPRAKFLRNLLLNMIAACLGAAIAMLGTWSGVQARLHTSPPGSRAPYNSSQAVVCAVWLWFSIYFTNMVRSKFGALQLPSIMFSIFVNVAFVYGPSFQTASQCESFIKLLIKTFFTGFGLSAGVSLFIFPVSSRQVVFKEMAGYLKGIQGTVKCQRAYLESMEEVDMFSETTAKEQDAKGRPKIVHPNASPTAKALKNAIEGLKALHGKLNEDMPFAKQEIAFGKLDYRDLNEMLNHFRRILVPLIGMSSIMDIFERVAEKRGWVSQADSPSKDPSEQESESEAKYRGQKIWNEIMGQLHEPFAIVSDAMDQALLHSGMLLEFFPKPKQAKNAADIEAKGDQLSPGDLGFSEILMKRVEDFYAGRGEALKIWARRRDRSLGEVEGTSSSQSDPPGGIQHAQSQQELYLILYMENLLYSTGMGIVDLVRFAEDKVKSGGMAKRRIILPGWRRLWKWLKGKHADKVSENPDAELDESREVHMGAGFSGKMDPEHLPATNAWQRFGNQVRKIPRALKSRESTLGFRVACATMSIAIVAYLSNTRSFFLQNRLVWAMIIVAISMNMTTGQSISGFLFRIVGTAISMVLCFVIWYIVDQKIPGVIVMLWLFIFIEMYFFMKFPKYISVWLVCMVTQVLIIGYSLQVAKIGIQAATSNGQKYYPVYELGPYRLATVAGGSLVAFIWTIFPYPLTDSSFIRRDLGASMLLVAKYYSLVHSTIRARVQGTEGDPTHKHSPGWCLLKARHKTLARLFLLLPRIQQHAEWQRWQPSLGGHFPRATYMHLIARLSSIRDYLSLMSFTSERFAALQNPDPAVADPRRSAWIADLRALLATVAPTSHGITSTLSLIAFSVQFGVGLPPYMQMPAPYELSQRLEELDSDILSSKHVEEPGYVAHAVMQVASSMVVDDLHHLVAAVRELVGEVDFTIEGVSEDGKGKKD